MMLIIESARVPRAGTVGCARSRARTRNILAGGRIIPAPSAVQLLKINKHHSQKPVPESSWLHCAGVHCVRLLQFTQYKCSIVVSLYLNPPHGS